MTARVCCDHHSKPVLSPATDLQLLSIANESSTHSNALSQNCSCWPSWVRSICSQALSHNHASEWGQVPSQKGLIENLRLDICSLKSFGLGPWPCRPSFLVLLNKREKDYFRYFWLPKTLLSISLSEAKVGAEGVSSESSTGTLWVEARVSKGTKCPQNETSRWCPDKYGPCSGEAISVGAVALASRQKP